MAVKPAVYSTPIPHRDVKKDWYASVSEIFTYSFKKVNVMSNWVCTSRDSNEQWTCDTSSIDRG